MAALAALLALTLAAAPKARPPSALDGCEATPVDFGWQYDCADVRARLDDRPETGEDAKKYVAAMAGAAPATVGTGATTRAEQRKLLGSRSVEVLVTEAPGERARSFIAAIPLEAGTRIVTCNGESARCGRILSGLAGVPWRSENARGSVRKAAARLALAGRPVAAPKGCEASTQPRGGRIVCAKTDWVGWVSLDEASARRMRTAFGDTMRKTLTRPGWKSTEREVPCRVAGAETSCVRVVAEAGSEAVTVLWAVAPAGGDWTFVNCMARGRTLGSPCSLVLEPKEP